MSFVKSATNVRQNSMDNDNLNGIKKANSEMTGRDRIKKKENELKLKKKMKEIGRTHPEFELSYDLLLGIRTSTSLINKSILIKSINNSDNNDSSDEDEDMLEKEFLDNKRYSFPSTGSSITPSHAMNDFEFKDYCRPIFAQLREWFGVTPQEYLVKLCGGFNLLEFISNSKSGQFFFYSHDGQFLIKSMTRSECKFLRKILPPLYHYIKNQPNTLLTKFYGMYRVKTPNRQPIYFVVMGSVFYTHYDIHRIYDIKGSTHGRHANAKDLKSVTPVLKDLDWIALKEKLEIGKIKAKMFKEQLKRDTQLLRKLKIMDYSLLIGIHYLNENDKIQALKDHSNPKLYAKEIKNGIREPTKISFYTEIKTNNNNNNNNNEDSQSNGLPTKHVKTWSNSIPKIQLKQATPIKINNNNNNSNNNNQKQPLLIQSQTSTTHDEDHKNFSDHSDHSINGDNFDMNDNAFKSTKKKLKGVKKQKKRIETRRISQIATKGKYIVKTPLNNNFDVPELINLNKFSEYNIRKKKKIKVANSIQIENIDDNKSTDDTKNDEFDYSESIFSRDEGGMYSRDNNGKRKNCIYFCGIIDILQKYNKRKKVENFLRGLNTDTSTISAVPPHEYSQRMYDFLKDTIV